MKRSIVAGINIERAFSAESRLGPSGIPSPAMTEPAAESRLGPSEIPGPAIAEPAAEIASVPVPSVPWYRAAGRSVLRALRPFAAPLLNRMDFRIRWALDRSNVAARLVEVERKADDAAARAANSAENITARLDDLARAATRIEQAFANNAENITARLDDLARAATRIEQAFANTAENITARLDDLARTATPIERAFATTAGMLEARIEGLDRTNAQRLIPLQIAAEKLDARSDLLVQRNIIGLGQELAVRTAAGYLLAPVEDPAVLVGLIEGRGHLEPGTTAVLQTLLHPGDIMVDVGGHIGTLALPAARCVGAAGRVIALEPAPRLADLLRRTMVLNHIGWVDVHECAAGEVEAVAHFALSAQTGHNSLFPTDDTMQQIEVTVRPLDALIPPGTTVHVVKVDAEGAELQVWRGMRRILADNPAVAVLLEFGPEHLVRVGVSVAEWFAEVTAHGHTPWEIEEETGRVRPLRTAGLEDVYSFNVLLLRDAPTDRGLVLA